MAMPSQRIPVRKIVCTLAPMLPGPHGEVVLSWDHTASVWRAELACVRGGEVQALALEQCLARLSVEAAVLAASVVLPAAVDEDLYLCYGGAVAGW
jgi:hypothetical protein